MELLKLSHQVLNRLKRRCQTSIDILSRKVVKHQSGGTLGKNSVDGVVQMNQIHTSLIGVTQNLQSMDDDLGEQLTLIDVLHHSLKSAKMPDLSGLKSEYEQLASLKSGYQRILEDQVLDPLDHDKILLNGEGGWRQVLSVFKPLVKNLQTLQGKIEQFIGRSTTDQYIKIGHEIKEAIRPTREQLIALEKEIRVLGVEYRQRSRKIEKLVEIAYDPSELEVVSEEPDELVIRIDYREREEEPITIDFDLYREVSRQLKTGLETVRDFGNEHFTDGEEKIEEGEEPRSTVLKPLESTSQKLDEMLEKLEQVSVIPQTGGSRITRFSQLGFVDNGKKLTLMVGDRPTPIQLRAKGAVTMHDNLQKMVAGVGRDLAALNDALRVYHQEYFRYALAWRQYQYYLITQLMVSTDFDIFTKEQIMYLYINRGTIELYLRIIDHIFKQIEAGKEHSIIEYFRIHHYYALRMIRDFFRAIPKETLGVDKYIDLMNSRGKAKMVLNLFNHLTAPLDAYYEHFQNQVSMYARINDWGAALEKSSDDLLFLTDPENPRTLIINHGACRKNDPMSRLRSSGQEMLNIFDETFGHDFTRNGDISKYIGLASRLAKKKGVSLITYGYSGVGKTTVMYDGDNGMLQTTLKSIRGLKKVRFRMYELFGTASLNAEIWNHPERLDQTLFYYHLKKDPIRGVRLASATPTPVPSKSGVDRVAAISEFLNGTDGFIEYDKVSQINTAFNRFGQLIRSIDRIRAKNGRIAITPNNPESSRSLMGAEFQLWIEDRWVPLLILDLPGRENPIDSYVDSYLGREVIQQHLWLKDIAELPDLESWYRAFLSAIVLNPIFLALLVPVKIFRAFNKLVEGRMIKLARTRSRETEREEDDDGFDRIPLDRYIFESEIAAVYETQTGQRLPQTKSRFLDEHVTDMRTKNTIRDIVTFTIPYRFHLVGISDQQSIELDSRHPSFDEQSLELRLSYDNPRHVPKEIWSQQYQSLIAIHLMNRLLQLGQNELVNDIMKELVDEVINSKMKPQVEHYRSDPWLAAEMLSPYIEKRLIDEAIAENRYQELVDQTLYYNFVDLPGQALVINNNILGIMKVLADRSLKKPDRVLREVFPEQDLNRLDFGRQRSAARRYSSRLYWSEYHKSKGKIVPRIDRQLSTMTPIGSYRLDYDHSVYIDRQVLSDMSNTIAASYSSDKIFNFDRVVMEPFLEKYFTGREDQQLEPITNHIVFYVFSNENLFITKHDSEGNPVEKKDLKCYNQYRLFDNTRLFAKMLQSHSLD